MNLKIFNEMLFPERIKCIVCGNDIPSPSHDGLCHKCHLLKNVHFCSLCGRAHPLKDKRLKNNKAEEELTETRFICTQCANYPLAFVRAGAPCVYKSNSAKLIYRLKYGNSPYLAEYMARFMVETYAKFDFNADFITFVPMSAKREKRRGFNQAESLANEVGKLLKLPVFGALKRDKHYKSVTKLTRRRRIESINGSISVSDGLRFHGQTALLIDDVLTSATTANFAAKALLKGGVKEVCVLTFATSYIKGTIKTPF